MVRNVGGSGDDAQGRADADAADDDAPNDTFRCLAMHTVAALTFPGALPGSSCFCVKLV